MWTSTPPAYGRCDCHAYVQKHGTHKVMLRGQPVSLRLRAYAHVTGAAGAERVDALREASARRLQSAWLIHNSATRPLPPAPPPAAAS